MQIRRPLISSYATTSERDEQTSSSTIIGRKPELCILFLVDQLTELGGGERSLFQLARNLELRGIRTIVVTFRGNPDPAVFELHHAVVTLPFGSCSSFRAIKVAMLLRRIIRDQRVQVVHTFFETSDIFGVLVARLSGVRSIVSSRRDMGILRSRRHYVAYRLLAPLYSAVVAVSKKVRQWHLITDRLSHEQIRTIHNGLSLSRFDRLVNVAEVRKALHLPSGVPLITCVTNISRWKGLETFIDAAALIHIDHPTAAFCIAGDWSDAGLVAKLKQQAHSLGIGSYVHFTGHVDDVAGLLLSSDVFTLLSRSEGFPNVVLEAMASKLPIVATSVGGIPEAISDGINGLLVESGDVIAAARQLSLLLTDKSFARKLGDAARETVASDFSLETMVQKHLELYDNLLTT